MGKNDIAVAPAVHRDGFDVFGRIETPWAEHVFELGADLTFELFKRLRFELVAIERQLLLFFTLNREDFSFVIHLDRQPRTSRRREAQTGSRARSGSRSERTLDAVEHSRTLMEWWPFLIFHRGGLRIKLKFPGRKDKNLNRFKQIAQN